MPSNPKTMVVGFPLFDLVTLVDLVGATQIFADTYTSADESITFQPVWLAPEVRPYQTSANTVGNQSICITPQFAFDDPKRPKLDMLFMPGGAAGQDDSNGFTGAMFDESYQNFIKYVAKEEAEWCGSVCTGAFVLAAAGLLDGCTATTYWSVLDRLRRFPNITVPEGYPRALIQRIEIDGIDKGRFTGGGVSSSLDLALALVKHISGQQVAERAQLMAQYSPDPIINFGDPSEASQGMVEEGEVVKELRQIKEEPFIKPTREAVDRILGC